MGGENHGGVVHANHRTAVVSVLFQIFAGRASQVSTYAIGQEHH